MTDTATLEFTGFGRLLLAALAITASVGAAGLVAPAAATQTTERGDPATGERVFQAHCAMCHGADGTGMMGMHPSLRGAVDRLSREGVEVTIRNGRRTQPPMPAFEARLSDQEIDDVVVYIESLPDGPRNFGPDRDMPGGMMGGDRDGWVAAPMLIALVLLAATVGAAVAWLVARRGTSPQRILERRYAAGELSREQYLEQRNDLS